MADVSVISVLLRAKDETAAAFSKVEANAGKMASGIAKHRRSIGMGMTAMGGVIVGLGVLSIKAASDVEEMRGKFNTVFGSMSGEVEKWAGTHGDAVGRSRFKLMEYASTLQDTFVPMGFAREEASKFARSVTELAVDIGSFNNQPTEEVVRSLQSALVGNTETVRKYGIVITAASVEQRILNEGTAKNKSEITEAMKVQARMNMIMEGSTDAIGDAQRTSGSFANQMVRLKSAVFDAQVSIGEMLLPIVTALVEKITPIITKTIKWIENNQGLTKVIVITAGAIGALMLVLGPLLLILPGLTVAFGLLTTVGLGPIGVAIALITAAIIIGLKVWRNWDKIVDVVRKTIGTFTKQVIGFIIKLGEGFLAITKWIPGMGDARRAIEGTMDSLRNAQDTVADWGNNTGRAIEEHAEAWGAMEDSHHSTAGAIKTQNAIMGDSATNLTGKVQTETVAQGKAYEALTEKVKGFNEQKTYFAQLNADTEREIRNKSRAEYIKGIEEGLAAAQARRDEEAKIAQGISDSWSKFKQDQDVTMQALKESNISFTDLVEELAIRHDTSVSQMADRLAIEGVRMGDTWGLVQQQGASSMQGLISEIDKASQTVEERMADMGRVMSGAFNSIDRGFTDAAGKSLGLGQGGMASFQQMTADEQIAGITGKSGEILSGQNLVDLTAQGGGVAAAAIDLIQGRWENDPGRLANEKILLEGGYGEVGESARTQARNSINSHLRLLARNPKFSDLNQLTKDMGTFNYENSFGQAHAIDIARQLAPQKYGKEREILNMYASGQITAFARGGIVTRPTLGLVGEAGPEAIVPLGRGGGMGVTNQFHFHGAVYGVEDLKEAVVEAVRDHAISGGFSGVFAEA